MAKEVDVKAFWPEWEIEKLIGRGSYGAVYRARKDVDGALAYSAIKVISIPYLDSEIESMAVEGLTISDSIKYYKQLTEDIIKEVSFMESCKDDSNIVAIQSYKVVEEEDKPHYDIYIRMELLTPLNTYLCDKTLSEQDVIKLGIDMCNALSVCERKNIIHRDIKPENIFVNEFGDFKLGDFGIARSLEGMTFGFSQKGTFNYMAPEVFNSSFYDSRADIYSLGIVLYKFLNHNRLPFLDSEKQLLSPTERRLAVERRLKGDKIPPIKGVSPELSDIITKACSYSPEDRFETAEAMKNALLKLSSDGKYSEAISNCAEQSPATKNSDNSLLKKCLIASAGVLFVLDLILIVLALKEGLFKTENKDATIDNETVSISTDVLSSSESSVKEVAVTTESATETVSIEEPEIIEEPEEVDENPEYEEARALLKAGEFDEAVAAFAKLEDYKKSKEYIEQINSYLETAEVIKNLDFEKAYAMLSSLDLIKQSKVRTEDLKIIEKVYGKSKSDQYYQNIDLLKSLVTISDEDKRYLEVVCKAEHFMWAVEHGTSTEEIGTLTVEIMNDEYAREHAFTKSVFLDDCDTEGDSFRGNYNRRAKRSYVHYFSEDDTLEEIYVDDDDKPDYYYIVFYYFENNFEGRDCKRVITVELDGEVTMNNIFY